MSWPSRSQSVASQTRLAGHGARRPASLGGPQRFPDLLELGGLVAAVRRPGAVEPVGPQQHGAPSLPSWLDVFRLEQIEQVAFSWQDDAIAATDGVADVLRLAGLLSDDDLFSHDVHGKFFMAAPPDGPDLKCQLKRQPIDCPVDCLTSRRTSASTLNRSLYGSRAGPGLLLPR